MLRAQLLRWLLYPLVALLAVDAFVSWGLAHRFARDAQDKALVEVLREVALQLRPDALGQPPPDLPEAVRRLLLEDPEDRVYYEVTDAAGRRQAGHPVPAPTAAARAVPSGAMLYDARVEGADVRAAQMRLPDGRGTLRVAETRHQRDAMARQILAIVVLPQVLLIVLAGAIVRLGVDRGLRPLQDLQLAVARRSHKDLSPIDEAPVPGEVRPLVKSVNALLQRVEAVLTLQSRFIADAAHQLKTPVAGLQAHVELLARQPFGTDQGELLGRLQLGAQRLSRLVSQLLSLARNEPEAARMIDFVPVDLNALVLETASSWVPQALRCEIDLGLEDCGRPVVVTGDPGRLRELFDNLIDNAIRYSHRGGRVTVRLHDDPLPTVAVSDDGPVIPPAEHARVFERFHRLLGSGEGSGLGLAIALEIAHLHGARIGLQEDADGVGNRFSVTFERG